MLRDIAGEKARAHSPLDFWTISSATFFGTAVYSMQFDSYSEVPKAVAEEIVQKSKGD